MELKHAAFRGRKSPGLIFNCCGAKYSIVLSRGCRKYWFPLKCQEALSRRQCCIVSAVLVQQRLSAAFGKYLKAVFCVIGSAFENH